MTHLVGPGLLGSISRCSCDPPEPFLSIQRQKRGTPETGDHYIPVKDQVDPLEIREEHICIASSNAILYQSFVIKIFLSVLVSVIHIIRAGPGQVVPTDHRTAAQTGDVPIRDFFPIMRQAGLRGSHQVLVIADRMRGDIGCIPKPTQDGHPRLRATHMRIGLGGREGRSGRGGLIKE